MFIAKKKIDGEIIITKSWMVGPIKVIEAVKTSAVVNWNKWRLK